jgi:hypothetical protein
MKRIRTGLFLVAVIAATLGAFSTRWVNSTRSSGNTWANVSRNTASCVTQEPIFFSH